MIFGPIPIGVVATSKMVNDWIDLCRIWLSNRFGPLGGET